MPKHTDLQAAQVSDSAVILSKLNHAFTPPELFQLNQKLAALLVSTDTATQSEQQLTAKYEDNALTSHLEIEKIIDQRANMVKSLLNNLDEQQKRCFAAYEVKTNDYILQEVTQQRSSAKEELAKISKASKGIKKYQQV